MSSMLLPSRARQWEQGSESEKAMGAHGGVPGPSGWEGTGHEAVKGRSVDSVPQNAISKS